MSVWAVDFDVEPDSRQGPPQQEQSGNAPTPPVTQGRTRSSVSYAADALNSASSASSLLAGTHAVWGATAIGENPLVMPGDRRAALRGKGAAALDSRKGWPGDVLETEGRPAVVMSGLDVASQRSSSIGENGAGNQGEGLGNGFEDAGAKVRRWWKGKDYIHDRCTADAIVAFLKYRRGARRGVAGPRTRRV